MELIMKMLTLTVGSRHRRYLRLQPSRRETFPHPERRPDGYRCHLDPLVLDHQAP